MSNETPHRPTEPPAEQTHDSPPVTDPRPVSSDVLATDQRLVTDGGHDEPHASTDGGAAAEGPSGAPTDERRPAGTVADRGEPVLSVENLTTVFRTEERTVRAVDGISFDLHEGEVLGLVGESGAGKSATARSVLRLIESPGEIVGGRVTHDAGDVLSMDQATLRAFRATDTGMVFQDPTTTLNPTMPVGRQVREAVEHGQSLSGSAAREEAVELLERVGIPDPANRADDYPHEFSGGQKQRIVVAIAIASEPDVLIADEPTTALDVTIQAQILELLDELRHDMGMAILFITHDLGVVRELCDRVAVMYAGSVVETGPVESLFTDPRHPYTKGLLASVTGIAEVDAGGGDRLDVIEGSMPDLSGDAVGCKYADRCPGATEACREAHPELESVDEDRRVACYHHEETATMSYEYDHEPRSLSWQAGRSEADDGPVLAVEGLEKHFTSGGLFDRLFGSTSPIRAVDGIDLSIDAGSTVGLVGESGCGKSTAARSLLRLLEPTDGTVSYRGTDVTEVDDETLRTLRRDLQIVFQDPRSSLNPRRTVRQVVRRPMDLHDLAAPSERAERVEELIDAVGLEPTHLERYPHELSGGQQQRVGIARALAVNPEVIVLDEPVSGLDVSVQAQILNLLADLQEELDLVYLFISHDLSVIRHVCDRVAVMYLGEIVEHGDVADVFDPPYHPYTESLLSAIPGRDEDDRILLEGNVPDPSNVPSGCRFHPRCPRKIGDVCETETPTDHAVGDHSVSCHLLREEYADLTDWAPRDSD